LKRSIFSVSKYLSSFNLFYIKNDKYLETGKIFTELQKGIDTMTFSIAMPPSRWGLEGVSRYRMRAREDPAAS
jgi:hypothetical protein